MKTLLTFFRSRHQRRVGMLIPTVILPSLRSAKLVGLALVVAASQLPGQLISYGSETIKPQIDGLFGINSFVMENFEDDRFPPAGWTLEFTGAQFWTRYVGASGYGIGTSSATFDFFDAHTNTTQSLVLSSMGSTGPNDTLIFDHAYATYQSEMDRLIIETSFDGGTTYTTLVTLNGGVSGSLVTAPPTTALFIPTASQWATKQYALPWGTNRVRFKAVSAYGNNLYLDNCTIGTRVAIDVGVQSIDIPNPTLALQQIPKATVKNHGTPTQTFSVTLLISPGGYASTRTITALAGNATSQVSFDGWTPTAGLYDVLVFANLVGDMDHTNDTLRAAIPAVETHIGNINASFRDGQVFITWDNIAMANATYTLYRSPNPIQHGYQLSSAQNLGAVRGNSSLNERLTSLSGGTPKYLKIDSASAPLTSNRGLFVATSPTAGSFYYAVTANAINVEDTAIVPGSNALTSPLNEAVLMPQPVWQESRVVGSRTYDIYVQYVSKVTSSIYPQMTNIGSFPFHFAIVKSGSISPHPVTFWMHGSVGNFLPTTDYRTIGDPNEWVITIDDWVPNGITFYYGFHEDYDMYVGNNPVPTSGTLFNYTSARVIHTVEWALRYLPLDTARTYMTGWSMGAIGSVFSALAIPSKIAAIFVYAPILDLWNPPTSNPALLEIFNRLWGTPQTNLLTNEGYRRNERLNATFLASSNRLNSLPVIYTFCGKNDVNVGWQEKISFYDSLSVLRLGGFHFWSMTNHSQVFNNSPWQPTFPNFSFFTRYRANLSYPAFSNCSSNDNPGNGSPSNGDPIGAINGHLDWNDNIVDTTNRWEITLRLKDLFTTVGSDIAPDSATTDVTLRRLQAFAVPPNSTINWENRRNGIVVQQTSFVYDSGLITLPAVKVYKDSSRLTVTYGPVSIAESHQLLREFALEQNYPNPFNPTTEIRFQIPDVRGQRSEVSYVTLKVFDILGREVATLVNEVQEAGYKSVQWDASGVASGVYLYRLQAGSFVETKKLVVLR